MEFRILGPVEAVADGGSVELGGGKLRTLLGLLALDANRVVSSERLIEALWGAAPPETATNTLQVYVSQLRRALREAEPGSERLLVTRRPGYELRVEPRPRCCPLRARGCRGSRRARSREPRSRRDPAP